MERYFKGTSATLKITFQVDGVATDPTPDAATVEIVHSDGTVLVAAGTPANPTPGEPGEFFITLPPAQTATRGDLIAKWSAMLAGHLQAVESRAEIVTFNAAEVRDRIGDMCDSTSEPTLSTDQLWDLVRKARRDDVDGLAPSDLLWVETYDENHAAAEGWRRKAGKVAPNYSFAVDNQRSDQGQVYEHCLTQAAHYAALGSTFVRLR